MFIKESVQRINIPCVFSFASLEVRLRFCAVNDDHLHATGIRTFRLYGSVFTPKGIGSERRMVSFLCCVGIVRYQKDESLSLIFAPHYEWLRSWPYVALASWSATRRQAPDFPTFALRELPRATCCSISAVNLVDVEVVAAHAAGIVVVQL
jgi:hypothetical protein